MKKILNVLDWFVQNSRNKIKKEFRNSIAAVVDCRPCTWSGLSFSDRVSNVDLKVWPRFHAQTDRHNLMKHTILMNSGPASDKACFLGLGEMEGKSLLLFYSVYQLSSARSCHWVQNVFQCRGNYLGTASVVLGKNLGNGSKFRTLSKACGIGCAIFVTCSVSVCSSVTVFVFKAAVLNQCVGGLDCHHNLISTCWNMSIPVANSCHHSIFTDFQKYLKISVKNGAIPKMFYGTWTQGDRNIGWLTLQNKGFIAYRRLSTKTVLWHKSVPTI